METQNQEVKQIAARLLSGMLANPHIYSTVSDELGKGRQEQDLIVTAIQMAEILIAKVDKKVD